MSDRAGLLALLTLTAVVWGRQLGSPFQYDDWNVIVASPAVHSLAAWCESMPGIRPLLRLSYALDYALAARLTDGPQSGDFVKFFHATNLVLHLTNVVLVWSLLRRWPGFSRRPIGVWLAAAVFALHPVQGEVAIYVSGRAMSLMGFFLLISVHCWLRAVATGGDSRVGRIRWGAGLPSPAGWGSLAGFAAAIAVRETAVVFPFLLWFWRRAAGEQGNGGGTAARRLWPYWVVAALALIAMLALPRYRALLDFSLGLRSPVEQLGVQIDALAHLWIRTLLLLQTSIDPVPASWRNGVAVWIFVIGLLMSAVAGFRLLRRAPAWGLALLWPWVFLLPVYSVIPRLDPVADRHWYLALLGPAVLLAAAVGRLRPPATAFVTVAVAGALALAGVTRAADFSSESALWRDATRQSPGSARIWNNLGYARAAEGDRVGAMAAYARALELDPGYRRAAVNLEILRGQSVPSVGR